MAIAIRRKLEWYQNRTRTGAKNISKDIKGGFIIVKGPFH